MAADFPRVARAARATHVALFDPLFPQWAKGFHAEYEYGEIVRRLPARCAVFGMESGALDFYRAISGASEVNPELAKLSFPSVLAGWGFPFKVAYSCFPRAIHHSLPKIVAAKARYCFTAYPGAFLLENETSDRRLLDLLGGAGFRRVLATQPITRDYLIDRLGANSGDIEFQFGGVFRLPAVVPAVNCFARESIRIVFCAHRHMPGALDKGLDVFFSVAKLLRRFRPDIAFVLVGPFDQEIGEMRAALGGSLVWYPYLHNSELLRVLSGCDLFLSYLRPNLVQPGRFDGFPVAAAVQAAAAGVLVLSNDPLNQGRGYFDPGCHYVDISESASHCRDVVIDLIENPGRAREVAIRGQKRVYEIYDLQSQLLPRLQMIENCL